MKGPGKGCWRLGGLEVEKREEWEGTGQRLAGWVVAGLLEIWGGPELLADLGFRGLHLAPGLGTWGILGVPFCCLFG